MKSILKIFFVVVVVVATIIISNLGYTSAQTTTEELSCQEDKLIETKNCHNECNNFIDQMLTEETYLTHPLGLVYYFHMDNCPIHCEEKFEEELLLCET